MVAVLVNSIIIVIGLGIYGIVFREFTLAVVSRESQTAFYAADTLAECVLYWDQKRDVLGSHQDLADKMVCDKKDNDATAITLTLESGYPSTLCPGKQENIYDAVLTMQSSRNAKKPSADIMVDKKDSCDPSDPFSVSTELSANGYNNDTPGDPKRIERGLDINY